MNKVIKKELRKIEEVAHYLCEKNWVEASGGNISINLSKYFNSDEFKNVSDFTPISLNESFPVLDGHIIYLSGTGRRMRDLSKKALAHGVIIRIISNGAKYEVISPHRISPTSELSSHLRIHAHFVESKSKNKAVLHTHPEELIALSHCTEFLDEEYLTKRLWSMMPETRIFIPKGVGLVTYVLTGSKELAKRTMEKLKKYDVLIWEKHGVLSVGKDLQSCLDILEILTKSARILLIGKAAGFEPQGLTDEQMHELAKAFSL